MRIEKKSAIRYDSRVAVIQAAVIAKPHSASCYPSSFAVVAQLVEHVLGKDEVIGSIPIVGSRIKLKAISPMEERAGRNPMSPSAALRAARISGDETSLALKLEPPPRIELGTPALRKRYSAN